MELIAYLRLSLEEQHVDRKATKRERDKAKRLGFAAQKNTIVQWAEAMGHTIVIWLQDEASGKNMDRQGLRDALRHLRHGEADGLVVAKLDRVSRSVPDFGTLLETAKRQGWKFIAVDLGVDTSTAAGELVAGVMMQIAQWERRVIGERTSDALQALKRQGARLGRPSQVPAEVRTRVQRWRARGWTYQKIADRLNATGVPTSQGGTCWRVNTVRGVLRSARLDAEATKARGAA